MFEQIERMEQMDFLLKTKNRMTMVRGSLLVTKTIQSCETLEQLEVAENLLKAFVRQFKTDTHILAHEKVLYEMLQSKRLLLKAKPKQETDLK